MRLDFAAAMTWDRDEALEETNRRIHDGHSSDEELLVRSNWYISNVIFGNFPEAIPPAGGRVLEIGSGVGWIMQAIERYLSSIDASPSEIIGLDIAPNMAAKARQRLGNRKPFIIRTYDGISVPFTDGTLDLIYSVACLQHIPRPFVFNLLFEVKRLLRPTGYAVLHFQSTSLLPEQERYYPWRTEINNQINNREAHWHHYYTEQELHHVSVATGFKQVSVKDNGAGALVLCVAGDDVEEPKRAHLKHSQALGGLTTDPSLPNAVLTRLQDAEAQLVKAVGRVNALEQSTSWRVTAPLRSMALVAKRLSGRAKV